MRLEDTSEKFCAEKFVDDLLTEGNQCTCDETSNSFNFNEQLPYYYDETLFKRGQSFFYKHIFALFLSKLLGLLTVLAIPTSLQILILTGMSSSNLSAYKRYMSTIFHMCIWYEDDFKPGSRLWESISEVKKRHNSASKKSCTAGLNRISQKDMAFTQFGFMGYAIVRSKLIGIHNATNEDLHAFISTWRVIGHLMGIEERFNICRESVQETKDICNILISKVFQPALNEKNKDFLTMSSYLINGLWAMNPFLEYDVFMSYLYLVIENNHIPQYDTTYINLNQRSKMKLKLIILTVYSLKYQLSRFYHNLIQIVALWLMKNCPFLAYYRYGKDNSHVKIL